MHSLHVGTLGLVFDPTASTIVGLMEDLKGSSLISVDPNCRPSAIADLDAYRAGMKGVMERSDLVKLSDEDAAVLAPGIDPAEFARGLAGAGQRLVVLTKGADGAAAFGRELGAGRSGAASRGC